MFCFPTVLLFTKSSVSHHAQGPSAAAVSINKEVLEILHEHCSSNQNILHVCCYNPSYITHMKHAEVYKLMDDYSKGECS